MKSKFTTGIVLTLCAAMLAACSSANSGVPAASAGEEAGGAAAAQSITVNAVSFLPKDDPLTASIHEWVKMVEEATSGEVTINWRGGADIIPPGEQANAVQTGAIDLIFNHTGQYESQNREVSAMPLSRLTPWEERENGFFEAMAEAHKKIDMVYLGRWLNTSPRIWLKEPITSLSELNGKKIRATGNYTRFFESLGINSVIIDPAEVYTSLQTGVVEGFVYGGLQGPRKNGWTDSAKYVLDHPFWNQNVTIVMNPQKWESISSDNQQRILEATAEYEKYMVEHYNAESEKERAALEEAGVTFIQFSEAEGKAFVDQAFNVEWEYLATEIPDSVETLRSLSE